MKKGMLALLVAGACWGAPLHAQDWGNVPLAQVQKAAEQGDAKAQFNLGVRYVNGEGVAHDNKQAVAWYHKAAEQGHVVGQNNLGAMYENGQGVAQDYQQAYVWYSVAVANNWEPARYLRDRMAAKLTPASLAEAQALASRYFEQYQPKQ